MKPHLKTSKTPDGASCVLLAILVTVSIQCMGACSKQQSQQGPGVASAPPPEVILPVKLIPQELTNWCWAASGQMTMQYLGREISQCEEVNKELARDNCCPGDDSCNWGGWPQFENYNFTVKKTCRQALSWDQLKAELSNNRPVAFSWLWGDISNDSWNAATDPTCKQGGPGHMLVATGYQEKNGLRLIFYNDPINPNGNQGQVSYEEFANSSSLHHHWNDFYLIQKVRP
jgi:hypothetical protein